MAAVAALLDNRDALALLRRGLSRRTAPVLAGRSPELLRQLLATRIIDAVVLGTHQALKAGVAELRMRFPSIPVVTYGALRADDTDLILGWHRLGVRAVGVEGVDDAVIGDLVAANTATALRRQGLRDAPRLLRLTEELQLATWAILMEEPGQPVETTAIAERLEVSREHLSRQFGAGGAPNLKRVIDFLRVVAVAELAANPGHDQSRVAELAGFASVQHLRNTVVRIAGISVSVLAGKGPEAVLSLFVRGGMRSRG